MLITGIERTKKGRYSIFADGEFLFALHADIFASSPIKSGIDMTEEALEELRALSEEKITKDRALRLLSARAYTSGGLYKKLIMYSDEDTAQKAVDRMCELGLINDEDYARRYAADCVNLRGFSPSRTKYALLEKGVPKYIAEEITEEMDSDQCPVIAAVILRKYHRFLDDEKGITKTTNALARLGYRYGDIRNVINNLSEDIDYYCDEE